MALLLSIQVRLSAGILTSLSVGWVHSAGLANNHLASEQNISRRQIGVGDAIEHHCKRDSADISARLVLRRKWHRQEARIFHIVDPDDPNIFGNSLPDRDERVHQLSRGEIIGAEKRIGAIFLQNSFYEFLIRCVPEVHGVAKLTLCSEP